MTAVAKKLKAEAPAGVTDDPLLAAINEYRFGGDQYDELPGDLAEDVQEAEFDRLVGEPLARLENWMAPAGTFGSVLAALQLAHSEHVDNPGSALGTSMTAAALGFFGDIPKKPASQIEQPTLRQGSEGEFGDQFQAAMLDLMALSERAGEAVAERMARASIIAGALFIEQRKGREKALRVLDAVYRDSASERVVFITESRPANAMAAAGGGALQ